MRPCVQFSNSSKALGQSIISCKNHWMEQFRLGLDLHLLCELPLHDDALEINQNEAPLYAPCVVGREWVGWNSCFQGSR
jgi:hypothetical protein